MTSLAFVLLGVVGGVAAAVGLLWRYRRRVPSPDSPPAATEVPGWLLSGVRSPEGLALALCEAVRAASGRLAAVVVRDPATQVASVVAIAPGLDHWLLGRSVAPASAVGRAATGEVSVAGASLHELFGHRRLDRRRRDEAGVAIPLRSGRAGVGALVVFGPQETLDRAARDRIAELVADAGPRLAHAVEERASAAGARTDPVTGLPNRRGLDEVVAQSSARSAALLCLRIDGFDAIVRHGAGDAALRHVAGLLRDALRDGDLPARLDGDEFAVWLPQTSLRQAVLVAERIRAALAESPVSVGRPATPVICSMGVGAVPETVGSAAELYGAVAAAVERARARGRGEVEVAS